MGDLIKIELGVPDLVAIISLARILAEHLEQSENRRDADLLPSDQVRSVIALLSRDRGYYNHA